MKLSVLRTTLAKGLQKATSATGTRTTLAVLGNVFLEAKEGKLTIVGTDLEVRIEVTVDAIVERAGKTTLPARKFLQMVNLCESDTVSVDVNEQHHARVEAGSASYLLYGLSPDDFPPRADAALIRDFMMPQPELAHAVAQVAYSVNADESRRILTGILFSVKNETFIAAGTDGKRLSLVEKVIQGFSGAEGDSVVPLHSADQLRQILDKQGDVKISMSEKHAEFEFPFDNGSICRMMCKLLEGNYPNFRQVIPKELSISVAVPTKPFLSALERVSLTSGGETPVTKLTFVSGLLRLESRSDGFGEGSDSIPVEYTGNELVLHLNTKFISDPFRNANTETVNFKINDGTSPIVLETANGFLSVIMPIRGRTPAPAADA